MEKTTVVKGRPLYYRVYGTGTPVMLIHGFGEDGSVWDTLLHYLPQTCRYLIPDLPGSGRSPLPQQEIEPSIDYLADCLKELYELEFVSPTVDLSITPPGIWIGHSMGGYVVLSLAERYPSWISGLVLVHSTAYADTEEKKANRLKSIEFMRQHGSAAFLKETAPNLFGSTCKQLHPKIVTEFIVQYAALPVQTLIWYARAMMERPDRSSVLSKTQVPVGFLIGMEDVAVPAEQSFRQAPLARYSYVQVLDQTGHMGMLEAPVKTAAFLEHYLREAALWKEPERISY